MKSFRDPITGILKCCGYVETNDPTDIVQEESEDFNLYPGKWRWDGTKWIPVIIPPIDLSDIDNLDKMLKAICIYFGQQVGKTPAQVKAGIKTVYQNL